MFVMACTGEEASTTEVHPLLPISITMAEAAIGLCY